MKHLRSGYKTMNRIVGWTLIPILSFLVLLGIYSYTIPNRNAPVAVQGVLDLSHWDFGTNGFISLNGQWEYYRGRLLSPEELKGHAVKPDRFIEIPSAWFGGRAPIEEDYGIGSGTYRLTIKLNDPNEMYGIRVNNILTAHRLFVDGYVRGESGTPAGDELSYRPGNTPYTTIVSAGGSEMVLTLQVSNYTYWNGGGVDDIQFGLQKDMLRMSHVLYGTELSGIFILLLFGGYHMSIYVMRFKDKAYLYSGIFFLTLLLMLSMMGEKLLLQLWPQLPFEFASKVYDLGGFSCYAVLAFFLHHLDKKLISRKHLLYWITPIAIYLAAVLVLPYSVYQQLGNIPWDYVLLLVIFYFYRTVRLFIKQDGEQLNRKEVAMLGGVMISIVMIMVLGVLYSLGLLETDVGRRIFFLSVIAFMNTLLAFRLAQATEQTEKLTEQLLLRDQLKNEFLANTSHELKTPLHGIQNMASYLLEEKAGALTSRQRKEITLIRDSTTKLSTLVNDLVDVVQMKNGDLRLQESVMDVRVIAETVFQVLEFELMGKDVQWVNRIAPRSLVRGDENRVWQVLYNLIHNAIKHTQSGWIEVSAGKMGDDLSVSVEDTGTGIPIESQEAVFGYFEQAGQTWSQDGYTGMGLGLYISRQLIERMHGAIYVERSTPGEGTRMTFRLPLVELAEAMGSESELAPMKRRESLQSGHLDIVDPQHGQTVLIVDDEAANVRVLLNLLSEEYNVLTAFSAKEAIGKLESKPKIDLMILDVMMPEVSGIELCRIIRETRSPVELPILFATVNNSKHDIDLCFQAGGNDFIAKPFDAKTLAARVRTLLSMKTSMEQALKNELAFLQAQIKPHFLYNAISSIISFCYTDGEKAAYLLSMLTRYLRFVFRRDYLSLHIPIGTELELIQAYVEVEKARFGERLEFKMAVDPALKNEMIPSLSIQPFVENAIRHGLFDKEGPGQVMLSISESDEYICCDITDDGVGMTQEMLVRLNAGEGTTEGIGVANARKRLLSIQGARLTLESALGQGTRVIIHLPRNHEESER